MDVELNYISDETQIVFDKYNDCEAVAHIYAPTKEKIASIRALLQVGLTYVNKALMYSWEYEEGYIDAMEYIFNVETQTLPIGLLSRAKKYLEKGAPNLKIRATDSIKAIFKNPNGNLTPEAIQAYASFLNIKNRYEGFDVVPYEHQIRLIQQALNGRRVSLLACTSAGKSLSMYVISRYLTEVEKKKVLVVTPSSALVVQLYSDYYNDYGWDNAKDNCTLIYGESEDKLTKKQLQKLDELNLGEEVMLKPITISTWQSLQTRLPHACPACEDLAKRKRRRPSHCPECDAIAKKSNAFFASFSAIIVDEAHSTRGVVLREVLDMCVNAVGFKVGLSGTLPDDGLDAAWIEGSLGRKEVIIRLKQAIQLGILTKTRVYAIRIPVEQAMRPFLCRQDFRSEYSMTTTNGSRKAVIDMLITAGHISTSQNTVILYKGKDTLNDLCEYLQEKHPEFKYRVIIGDKSATIRDEIRTELESGTGYILIATYGTMKQGVNIRLLHNLVFAEYSKSMYEVLQSVGRIVRKHKEKEWATVFDISDDATYYTKPRYTSSMPKLVENYSSKHYNVRKGYYDEEEIPITEFSLEGLYEAKIDKDAIEKKKAAAKEKASAKKVKGSTAKGIKSKFA